MGKIFQLSAVGEQVSASVGEIILIVLSIIPKFFYFLYTCAASVIDLFQYLFRSFAGLDTIYVDGKAYEGDLLYHFFVGIVDGTYPALQAVFWSIIILAIIILFLSTLVAVFKSETVVKIENKRGEKKVGNMKGKIMEKAGLALVWIALVPIVCIFGTYLGNILLKAVDGAVSANATDSILQSVIVNNDGDLKNASDAFEKNPKSQSYSNYDLFGYAYSCANTSFSGLAFKVVAYDSNRMRCTKDFAETVIYADETSATASGHFGIFNQITDEVQCAIVIDEAFANNAVINKNSPYSGKTIDPTKGVSPKYCNDGWDFMANYDRPVTSFSKYNIGLVNYFYDLYKFNFLIAYAFIILLFPTFYKIIFGLLKRLVILVGLFMIAPALIAFEPLAQDGHFFANWKKLFLSYYVTVFASVAGMNIFMIIQPYFTHISFFPPGSIGFDYLSMIVGLIIILVGIQFVNDFIEMVNDILGGVKGGLNSMGEDAFSRAVSTGTKAGKTIGGIGKGAGKVLGGAVNLTAQGMVRGGRAVRNAVVQSGLNRAESRLSKAQTDLNNRTRQVEQENQRTLQSRTDAFDRETGSHAAAMRAQGFSEVNDQRDAYTDKWMHSEYERGLQKGTIQAGTSFDDWAKSDKGQRRAEVIGNRFDRLKATKETEAQNSDRVAQYENSRRQERGELVDTLNAVGQQRVNALTQSEREERDKRQNTYNSRLTTFTNIQNRDRQRAERSQQRQQASAERQRQRDERRARVSQDGLVKAAGSAVSGMGEVLKNVGSLFGVGNKPKK